MKKIISCIIFCLLTLFFINQINEVLIPKEKNRYYILEQKIEELDEEYLVHVYGACHSYTSFDPIYLEQYYDLSAYNYGNAGEIMPVTYLRMKEQFKKDVPEVALVEIWGINAYETYDTQDNIFNNYLPNNLERIPLSISKLQVIRDYDLDLLEMNLAIARYKDRLMNFTLKEIDFDYSFEATKDENSLYVYNEMYSRLAYNGFKSNPSGNVEEYSDRQANIGDGEFLEIESDIVKYLQKIIDLCKKYDVELIFYRSPYISTENELKKLNHLREICEENDLLFIDLEEVIEYDYDVDFYDYEHLSVYGANKSTEYLVPYIKAALNR